MKFLIVGMGLMGGAYAYRLLNKGYEVYGVDVKEDVLTYALQNKYIHYGSTNPKDFIKDMDVIILAIYPQMILKFLKEYKTEFKQNQIITDICGVKTSFVEEATLLSNPAIYCSHHPMAGKEKIGIEYSKQVVFEDANFLITPLENTPKFAVDCLNKLGKDLGFHRISTISVDLHDKVVGFTSQLTHAIAVSLVNSDHDPNTKNYIGDSYRDLTRIAMINETLWSELFLENRENLLYHICSFEHELDLLKEALMNDDKDALEKLFASSTKIRREMEK